MRTFNILFLICFLSSESFIRAQEGYNVINIDSLTISGLLLKSSPKKFVKILGKPIEEKTIDNEIDGGTIKYLKFENIDFYFENDMITTFSNRDTTLSVEPLNLIVGDQEEKVKKNYPLSFNKLYKYKSGEDSVKAISIPLITQEQSYSGYSIEVRITMSDAKIKSINLIDE